MHNRLWLSLMLALFLTASGCAKHEDTSSADTSSSAGHSEPVATQPASEAKIQEKTAPAEKRAEAAEKVTDEAAADRVDTLDKKSALQDKPVSQKPAVVQQPATPQPAAPASAPATAGATTNATTTNATTTNATTNAADASMEMDSASPQKSDVSGPKNQSRPKALRKKENVDSQENAKPSGDDMERMD